MRGECGLPGLRCNPKLLVTYRVVCSLKPSQGSTHTRPGTFNALHSSLQLYSPPTLHVQRVHTLSILQCNPSLVGYPTATTSCLNGPSRHRENKLWKTVSRKQAKPAGSMLTFIITDLSITLNSLQHTSIYTDFTTGPRGRIFIPIWQKRKLKLRGQ